MDFPKGFNLHWDQRRPKILTDDVPIDFLLKEAAEKAAQRLQQLPQAVARWCEEFGDVKTPDFAYLSWEGTLCWFNIAIEHGH